MWTKVVQSGNKEPIKTRKNRFCHSLEVKAMRTGNPASREVSNPATRGPKQVNGREKKATGCFVAIPQRAWTKKAGSSCRPSSSALMKNVMERSFTSPVRMDG